MKTALKYGVMIGVASILISLISYLINPALIFNMKLGIGLSSIATVVLLVLALREERKINEGILTFGDGLKTTFIAYAIGSFMSILFGYTLMNHIDPSLIDTGLEYSLEMTESALNGIADLVGMPEAEKDKQLEEMRSPEKVAELRDAFSFSSNMVSFLFTLLFPGLLFWLIIPAIMKKNPQGV